MTALYLLVTAAFFAVLTLDTLHYGDSALIAAAGKCTVTVISDRVHPGMDDLPIERG